MQRSKAKAIINDYNHADHKTTGTVVTQVGKSLFMHH
jgi:hypothetical protein